jgi:hypothetical protein
MLRSLGQLLLLYVQSLSSGLARIKTDRSSGLGADEFPRRPLVWRQFSTVGSSRTPHRLAVIARAATSRYIAPIHPALPAFRREEATDVAS